MAKKILIITILMLALVCVMASCGGDEHTHSYGEHTHSYGEWETSKEATCAIEGTQMQSCSCGDYVTKSIPKTDKHTFSNGKCTICNLSIVTAIGDIIKQSPDQYTSGAYIKSFTCSTFSSKEKSYNYGLGFAYNETNKTLTIQLVKSDLSTESISVTINNGVISNRYEYLYSYTNPVGGYTDKIQGVFTATSLSSTSSFTYTNYSAGSGKAFTYFVDDYKEDAANCAKLLTEYLNEFLTYNELGFTAEAFNLK